MLDLDVVVRSLARNVGAALRPLGFQGSGRLWRRAGNVGGSSHGQDTLDLHAVMCGLMRDVGAALRPLGFQGSGGVWRLITPEGVAVIEIHGWRKGTRFQTKQFYVATGVAPKEWLEWLEHTRGKPRPMNKAGAGGGIAYVTGNVPCARPRRRDRDRWELTADTDLDRLRADLVAGVTLVVDRLVELLQPGRCLDELRAMPDKPTFIWPQLVCLLAERGPSPELDAACVSLRHAFTEWSMAKDAEKLIALAHARAAR
jgi:hypothetical protein